MLLSVLLCRSFPKAECDDLSFIATTQRVGAHTLLSKNVHN